MTAFVQPLCKHFKLKTCEIIQYADDIALLIFEKSYSMEEFFTLLATKLNADKTEFIVFGKKNQPQPLPIREQKLKRKL